MKFLCFLLSFTAISSGILAEGEYVKDWQAFEKEVEKSYPFFKEKGIADDWRKAKPEWRKKAEECSDDAAFLSLVDEAIRLMRDGHAGIVKSRTPQAEPPPRGGLPVAFRPASDGKVVVASAAGRLGKILTPGALVLKIDGVDARQVLDKRAADSWKAGGYFSSPQRAAFLEYAMPLKSEEISSHAITFQIGNEEKEVPLKTDYPRRLSVYQFPADMTVLQGGVACALLPGGAGYLYLRRIMGDETARGIEEALAKYPDVPGWVVDLRGNGGGGYTDMLKSVLKKLVSQSSKLAIVIDAGCFSAGETFARDLKQMGGNKTVLIGSTTAGSSSSKKEWDFPSGVATVRFSVASRKGFKGKPIEFHGIAPDRVVESDPQDLVKGMDTEIVEAEKFILGTRG